MIADMLPLLTFVTIVVIARNAFEAYILNHDQQRNQTRELARSQAYRVSPATVHADDARKRDS